MNISNKEFDSIITGKQIYIISDNDNYKNKDKIILKNNNREILAEITIKYIYNSLDDCFDLLSFKLFGFSNLQEAKLFYKKFKKIVVYRIKVEKNIKLEDILDDKLLNMIDLSSVKKNTIGHSSCDIFELKLKNGIDSILKVQYLNGRNNLEDEYKRNKWLENILNVPKTLFFYKNDNYQYFLMEKKNGLSAHKVNGFANLIGKNLKEVHSIDISQCPFTDNETEKILRLALSKIDIILPSVLELYPDMNRESVIEFLKSNRPLDKVLVHGDYSFPNILIDEKNVVSLIDLGDVSISSKYFDLYYLKKSFIRNKKMDYFDEFLKSYGLNKLDEKYMKWMDIVDKVLY